MERFKIHDFFFIIDKMSWARLTNISVKNKILFDNYYWKLKTKSQT